MYVYVLCVVGREGGRENETEAKEITVWIQYFKCSYFLFVTVVLGVMPRRHALYNCQQ